MRSQLTKAGADVVQTRLSDPCNEHEFDETFIFPMGDVVWHPGAHYWVVASDTFDDYASVLDICEVTSHLSDYHSILPSKTKPAAGQQPGQVLFRDLIIQGMGVAPAWKPV